VAALVILSKLTLLLAESCVAACLLVAAGATKADVEVAERRAISVVSLYMLEKMIKGRD